MRKIIKVKFDNIAELITEELRLNGVIVDKNAYNDIHNTINNKPIIDKNNNAIGYMTSYNEGVLYLDYNTQLSDVISTPSDIGVTTINKCNFQALCIKNI